MHVRNYENDFSIPKNVIGLHIEIFTIRNIKIPCELL